MLEFLEIIPRNQQKPRNLRGDVSSLISTLRLDTHLLEPFPNQFSQASLPGVDIRGVLQVAELADILIAEANCEHR